MTSETSRSTSAVPFALLGTTVLLWGTGFWPTGVAAGHTTALMLSALRSLPAALVLLVAVRVLGASLPRGRMLGWALFTGLIMIVAFQWGATDAIARAGAGNAAIIVNTPPLFVVVFAWVAFRERATPVAIAGLVLGFAGVVLMVSTQLGGDVDTSQLLLGCGVALLTAIGWASGTLILKRLAEREGGIDIVGFTAVHYTLAAVLLTPIAFGLHGTGSTDWSSSSLWGPLVWIGPVNAIGALLFYTALARLSAPRVSAALFLVPAVAVVVEIVRGNSPDAVVLVGMVLAVLGVAIVNSPPSLWSRLGGQPR